MTVSHDQERHRQAQEPYSSAQDTYYALLRINPSSTVQEIRQAYRELSKLYHPDTTQLNLAEAKHQFQRLNEAYATLSNPEKRLQYDLKAGFSQFSVVQPPPGFQTPKTSARQSFYSSSAYLDPNDRPLSPGEVFALVILGVTFLLCLVLAVVLGFSHSEAKFELMRTGVSPHEIVADLKPSSQLGKPDKTSDRSDDLEATSGHESESDASVVSMLHSKMSWLPTFSELLPDSKMSQSPDSDLEASDARSPESNQTNGV
jgi:curved DNA-binding protein CbpA